jgi:hypothetical protein
MAKLIQICASGNDLFGLDNDGVVYHYNFNTSSWTKPGCVKHDGTGASDGPPMIPHEEVLDDRSRFETPRTSRRGA